MRPPLLIRFLITVYDGLILLFILLLYSIIPIMLFNIKAGTLWHTLYIASIYLIAFLYYATFWVIRAQTPAMKYWNTTIQQTTDPLSNRSISVGQALLRFVVAMLSWLSFGAGFIWIMTNKDRKTWHDLASNTQLQRKTTKD